MSKNYIAELKVKKDEYNATVKAIGDKAVKQFETELGAAKDSLLALKEVGVDISQVLNSESVKLLLEPFQLAPVKKQRKARKEKGPRFTVKKATDILKDAPDKQMKIGELAKALGLHADNEKTLPDKIAKSPTIFKITGDTVKLIAK